MKLSSGLIKFSVILLIVGVSYLWFIQTPLFDNLFVWAQQNFVLFIVILILLKFTSLIYPPMPGGIFTLGSIPIIGWQWAFISDSIGTIAGGIVNYYLARKYGLSLARKMLGDEIADKIKTIKIKPHKEFESVLLARIFLGSTILEVVHYAAGIMKVKFINYIGAMLLSQSVMGIIIFYLLGEAILSQNVVFLLIPLLIAIPLIYKYQNRYFYS